MSLYIDRTKYRVIVMSATGLAPLHEDDLARIEKGLREVFSL
jgi:hypothetical protein